MATENINDIEDTIRQLVKKHADISRPVCAFFFSDLYEHVYKTRDITQENKSVLAEITHQLGFRYAGKTSVNGVRQSILMTSDKYGGYCSQKDVKKWLIPLSKHTEKQPKKGQKPKIEALKPVETRRERCRQALIVVNRDISAARFRNPPPEEMAELLAKQAKKQHAYRRYLRPKAQAKKNLDRAVEALNQAESSRRAPPEELVRLRRIKDQKYKAWIKAFNKPVKPYTPPPAKSLEALVLRHKAPRNEAKKAITELNYKLKHARSLFATAEEAAAIPALEAELKEAQKWFSYHRRAIIAAKEKAERQESLARIAAALDINNLV